MSKASVSPGWASVELDGALTVQSSHRGGLHTRTSTAWNTSRSYRNGTIADRQNIGSRRDRARKVYAEHPIGRGLLQTETDNVVADGFTLQSKTGSREFDREVEDRWPEWLDRADVRGMRCGSELQRLMYRSSRRDGDGGVVLVDRGGESRLQYIPGDLVSTPFGKTIYDNVFDGIEVNGVAAPTGFYVKNLEQGRTWTWERVPASNFVFLAPVIDNDLGLRGDTCYSQIFPLLDGIDGYVDAVVIAARMAAIFGLIFKDDNSAKQFNQLTTLTNSQGNSQKAVTLENGMLKYMGSASDVVQVQAQQPMNQTPDFIRAVMRLIGIPFDMPLELVGKDMSQVNFASARIGLIGYYRACRARQKWFRTVCLDRIYRWWISREVKRGAFTTAAPADFWRHKFISVGWDYTDPVSEAQGDQLQVDMGTKTPQMVAAERGRDWEEMQEDLAAARMARRAKQLVEVASTMTRDRIEVSTAPASAEPKADPAMEFNRQAWLGLQSQNPQLAVNLIDAVDLTEKVGLPVNEGYEEPHMPVMVGGKMVTGGTINDPEGDVVGGDVETNAVDEEGMGQRTLADSPATDGSEAGDGTGDGSGTSAGTAGEDGQGKQNQDQQQE